ncbi:MAG: type I 3-dehydroquinate dehydratase [Candidatus Hydrogenedentes bacterium]|nr:type I 3-dehydroquinate dehydratase [Candidatus Hydrogenedentota bacterium]
MTHIGNCELGKRPRVVVALRDGVPRREVESALAAGADIIELRVDLFSSLEPGFPEAECGRFTGIPRLGTLRCAAEGGGWRGSEEERLACFNAILPHVEAVDIELSATDILDRVVEAAHDAGKTVIGSFHDFAKTPDDAHLEETAARADRAGVDILKVAAHCATLEDLRRLAAFTLRREGRPAAVIGMGPAGMPSRIFFPLLGSMLAYTFLGTPSAPGQLNCADTVKYLSLFCQFTNSPE